MIIIRKCFSLISIIVTLLAVAVGSCVLAGCGGKETTVTTLPATPVSEEGKIDQAALQASLEKISGYANADAVVSVYRLSEKTDDPGVLIFDTRGRTFRGYQKTYLSGHVPGAVPIIYSECCHPVYTGRMAAPPQLQNLLGASGAGNDTCIVFYGNDALPARLYWAMKMYGYDNIKLLDGGLDKWKEAGYDITPAKSVRTPDSFEFDLLNAPTESLLATLAEVDEAVASGNCLIVDARSKEDYAKGRIPGSINVAWSLLLNKDMTFKPASELINIFESQKKITRDKKIIVYSNEGIRSSMVWFALSELLGYPNVKNYDGSFNEWLSQNRQVENDLPADNNKTP